MRRLLAVPRHAARLVWAVAVLAVVAFFALTQTQVGRERLRQSLEAGFARQFEGSLHIGRLSGNLVGTLVADDVALVGPGGDTVVAARRVVAKPVWTLGLWRNHVELREASVAGLRVHAVRDTSRRWNVQDVFQARRLSHRPAVRNPTENAPRWRLGTPRLIVADAALWLEDRTPRPAAIAAGQVFDALNSRYTGLDAEVTVDGDAAERWVSVLRLRGQIPERAFAVERLAARLRLTDSTRVVYGLRLDAGNTRLRGSALQATGTPLRLDVHGTADFDALRRLVPALPLASAARIDLTGWMRRDTTTGRLDAAFSTLRLARAGATLDAVGTFAQTDDSLRLALDRLDATATPDVLGALVPRLPSSARARLAPGLTLALGPTVLALPRGGGGALRLTTSGRAEQGTARLDVPRLALARDASGSVRWDARLEAETLDLARYLPGRPPTVVSGSIDTEGDAAPRIAAGLRAGSWTVRRATARVRLGPSRVLGRALDSLRLNVFSDGATAGADVRAQGRLAATGAGAATFDVTATPAAPGRPVAAKGRLGFDRFDAGALLPGSEIATRLTGTADVDAQGRTLAEVAGTVTLALSDAFVRRGTDTYALRGLRLTARRDRSDLRAGRPAQTLLHDLAGTATVDVDDAAVVQGGRRYAARVARVRATRDLRGVLGLDVAFAQATLPGQGGPLDLVGVDARLQRDADGALALVATTPQGRVDVHGSGDLAQIVPLAAAYRPRLLAYLESRLPARDALRPGTEATPDSAAAPRLPPVPEADPALRLPARPLALAGTVALADTALLSRLVPGLHGAGVRVAFDLAADARALGLRLDLAADTLAHPKGRAGQVAARLDLRDSALAVRPAAYANALRPGGAGLSTPPLGEVAAKRTEGVNSNATTPSVPLRGPFPCGDLRLVLRTPSATQTLGSQGEELECVNSLGPGGAFGPDGAFRALRFALDATARHTAAAAFRADDVRLVARADDDRMRLRFVGLRRFLAPEPVLGDAHAEQRVSDALAEGDLDLAAIDAGALARDRPPLVVALPPPDTLRLALTARRLPDRLRVGLDTLAFGAASLRLAARPSAFDAYRDAVVLGQPVELTGAAVSGVPQVLRLSGVASRRPSDTLRVEAERVALGALLGTTPLRGRLGGAVDARLAVAAALARPDLTGDLAVNDLSLSGVRDGQPVGVPVPLGRLDLTAGYVQGDSTGVVSLVVRPEGGSVTAVSGSGTFRLPSGDDPGAIDVTADLARLDAALLDALVPVLFAGTEGRAHGLLTVQGALRSPDYAAEIVVDSARTSIPLLGTRARAGGFVRITPRGIALRSVRAVDPTGGTVVIDGTLDGPIGRPPTVNLALSMEEFRLIDLPAATDFPIYGQVWLTGQGSVKGTPGALRVTARDVVAAPRSDVFVPLRAETTTSVAAGYITFLDTLGIGQPAGTPRGLRPAVGLDLDLDVRAPSGTGFNLAFDPLVGDVMRARGAGRLQLRLHEGVFQMFGTVDIEGGDYLFTAGDVFVRRFDLDGGTLAFDGPPTNARLNVRASYRTRASLAGLPLATDAARLVPLVVRMDVTERLSAPRVALSLALDRRADARASAAVEGFESLLNQPERQAEYATSVLLTNSFLLTSQAAEQAGLGQSGNQLAFASLSQLVASQLNRYLADVLPGVELTLGLQGTRTSALDVTYGLALRLLDDRLTVRGQGVLSTDPNRTAGDALRGEFVVEVRLSPVVSAEVFYRREDDLLESVASGALTSTTGVNLSYRTRFTSWRQFWDRLRGHR